MNSPNESALTPENAPAAPTRGSAALGSKNSAPQARAVRTRQATIAIAARHFDTDGYGHTSINININLGTGRIAKCAMY